LPARDGARVALLRRFHGPLVPKAC
jgi:hypothetical protein